MVLLWATTVVIGGCDRDNKATPPAAAAAPAGQARSDARVTAIALNDPQAVAQQFLVAPKSPDDAAAQLLARLKDQTIVVDAGVVLDIVRKQDYAVISLASASEDVAVFGNVAQISFDASARVPLADLIRLNVSKGSHVAVQGMVHGTASDHVETTPPRWYVTLRLWDAAITSSRG